MKQNEYLPLEDISTSLRDHLDRAWVLLNDLSVNPDTYQYLYAALDLRFFIERLLSLILSVTSDHELSKRQTKLYRPNDFEREISLEKLNQLVGCIGDSDTYFPVLNFSEINEIYGKIGNYLHAPYTKFSEIQDEKSKLAFESVVLSAYKYLEPYVVYEYFE
jgi:hypothetical protein